MRLLLTIVLCMFGYNVFAQHQLQGVVKNINGETIPNSHVDLSSNCVDTDSSGIFTFNNLNSGTYTLKVSANGYGIYQEKIVLEQSKQLTIVLQEEDEEDEETLETIVIHTAQQKAYNQQKI